MTKWELEHEIETGVDFWIYEDETDDFHPKDARYQSLRLGVMGVQNVLDVTLVRHAYVKTSEQNKGIGGKLLEHVKTLTTSPLLVGTWRNASWAIKFYEKHGFFLVPSSNRKDELLSKYWSVSTRQMEESVVLVDGRYVMLSEEKRKSNGNQI